MKSAALAVASVCVLAACGGRDRWTIDDASFFPAAIDYWKDGGSFLVGSREMLAADAAIARRTAR